MKKLYKNKLLILLLITLVSNVLGLLREMVITFKFGTTGVTDVIITSQILPIMLLGYTFFTFTNAYIPFYQINKDRYTEKKLNSISFFSIITLAILSIVLINFFLDPIYNIFFGINSSDLLLKMTRLLFFVSVFMAITAIPMGYLQISEKFYIVNFSNMVIVNLAVVISIILINNPFGLAVGYVIGTYIAMTIILIFAINNGFKIQIKHFGERELVSQYSNIALSVISVSLINQVFNVIDRSIATHFQDGTVSSIYLSNRLISLFIMLLILPIVTISFPRINKLISEHKIDKANSLSSNIIIITILFTFAVTSFISVFSKEIIIILFNRGNFNSTSVLTTSSYLTAYIFFLFAWCIREINSKILLAYNMHRYLVFNTSLLVFFNIIFSLILSFMLGPIGIPLGSGMAISIVVLMMIKKIKLLLPINILIQIFISSFLLFLLNYFIYNFVGGIIAFIICLIILILYFIYIFIFNKFNVKDILKELN